MKNFILFCFFLILTNSFGQHSDKIKIYHENIKKTKLFLSNNDHLQALDKMIETLNFNLKYGDDAYILLSNFLENIPKEDSVYNNKISEYCILLASHGITFNEIKKIYKIANMYGNKFRSDSLKPYYYISHKKLKTEDFFDKKLFQKNARIHKKNKKKYYDRKLSNEIKLIGKIDQKNRMKRKDFSKDDNIVYQKLKYIVIENNGFPNFMKLRKDDYEIIETCLIHMDLNKLVEFLPYLIKGIQQGNLFINRGILYAIDRNSIENGSYLHFENETLVIKSDTQQVYNNYYSSGLGAFYCFVKGNSNKYLFPITNTVTKDNINKIRTELYLPLLEEDLIIHQLKEISTKDFNNLFFSQKLIINTF